MNTRLSAIAPAFFAPALFVLAYFASALPAAAQSEESLPMVVRESVDEKSSSSAPPPMLARPAGQTAPQAVPAQAQTPAASAPASAKTKAAKGKSKESEEPKAPAVSNYQADTTGEIVELPLYTVVDQRILPPPESWNYTSLPGFEVLSNASVRATQRFLKDFQQLQMAIRIVWPALSQTRPANPTLLLLCSRMGSFSQFVPEQTEPDMFITPTSLFVEDKERGAIVIDFGTQDMLTTSGLFASNDPYEQFYRQYSRFLMRRANNGKPIPPWLEEGLSRLFTTIDFNKKYIEFGKVENGFKGSGSSIDDYFQGMQDDPFGSGDFDYLTGSYNNPNDPDNMFRDGTENDPMRALGLGGRSGGGGGGGGGGSRFGYIMPMGAMFNPDPTKRTSGNWSNQCYAFVHMCLYGENKKYQPAFLKFAQGAMKGPVDETFFKECFGRTFRQMGVVLRGYVEWGAHQAVLVTDSQGRVIIPDPKPLQVRDASQAEIGRIKGEALRLAGHPIASRDALITPYLRRERDAALLASLGLLESLEGRTERARKFLESACKDKVVRPRAYAALARLRLDEALAKPEAENGKLSVAQTASVLEPLFIARKQPPSMEEVYALIGETWLNSAAAPKPVNLDVLVEGVTLFPRSTAVVYPAAALFTKYGSPDAAASLIKLGNRISMGTPAHAQFEELQAHLPPAPPPEAEAPPAQSETTQIQ